MNAANNIANRHYIKMAPAKAPVVPKSKAIVGKL
jgi:hypothetical protein